MPGRPADLDDSRTRAYCACSRYEWGCSDVFFSHVDHCSLLGDGPI